LPICVDALEKHPLAWHVAGESLVYDFAPNLLGLPLGEMFKRLSSLVF